MCIVKVLVTRPTVVIHQFSGNKATSYVLIILFLPHRVRCVKVFSFKTETNFTPFTEIFGKNCKDGVKLTNDVKYL